MKISIKNIISILSFVLIFSCDDYLDVQPKTKLLGDRVFDGEITTQNALNGCYKNMTKKSLYGEYLTMSALEVLGQPFNLLDRGNSWSSFSVNSHEIFDQVWSDMYKGIININLFIKGLDKNKTISVEKKNILRGEAIGLRAMCHFDLLRLYGPVYSKNPGAISIRYQANPYVEATRKLPANQVIKFILDDLSNAEKLLEKDPIRTYGKINVEEDNTSRLESTDPAFGYKGSNFYRFRNFRMNYYAVKALQARVNLYAGDKQEALKNAKAVIEQAGKWFPWTNFNSNIRAKDVDRLFSSEVIFALENKNIDDIDDNIFDKSLYANRILSLQQRVLNNFFQIDVKGVSKDRRYGLFFENSLYNGLSRLVFIKFEHGPDPGNNKKNNLSNVKSIKYFMQPLIRMSEMYYIAAETDTNSSDALKYLNTVRHNRGLDDLPATADLEEEITKEYKREFYGEGQLFFYYKRKNVAQIPSTSPWIPSVNMDDSKYVVPMPNVEKTSDK